MVEQLTKVLAPPYYLFTRRKHVPEEFTAGSSELNLQGYLSVKSSPESLCLATKAIPSPSKIRSPRSPRHILETTGRPLL